MKLLNLKIFIKKNISKIKLIISDVDGVLTDGGMYYGADGSEFKKFNVLDGRGVALLKLANIKVGIISGESSSILTRRCKKLNFDFCVQGCKNKLSILDDLSLKFGVNLDEMAFIGDGINDVNIMRRVGFPVAVKSASFEVKEVAKYITKRKGGDGVLDELANLILSSRHQLKTNIRKYLKNEKSNNNTS